VNDELERAWKEAVVIYSKYNLRIYLEQLRQITYQGGWDRYYM